MPSSVTFDKLYEGLNHPQREAVDTIEGPVFVVAGPGTGKTQILSLRIANLLRTTDTAPEQILALTFTEAGVAAMRARLISIIGTAAYRVSVLTFHGFCNDVISRFSSHFPEIIGSRPASELDRIELLQKVFDETKLESLASFRSPYHYVPKVLSAISLLKREAIGPGELRKRLDEEERAILDAPDYRHEKGAHKGKVKAVYLKREEELAKNMELALLFETYERTLAREKMYDFDDMILAVVLKLENDETFRLIMQEEHQYLLADEHQDANGAQNKVLELLSSYHESPNLFMVGDEKQAIYRFQGASLENFHYFTTRHPEARLITLTDNYRSTQAILDVALTVIPVKAGIQKHQTDLLTARSKHPEHPVFVGVYPTTKDEADALAVHVAEKITEGAPAHEIAIFTRTNRELALYADALRRKEIPVTLLTKTDVLDDVEIEKLLTLLRAVAHIGYDDALIRALHIDCFTVPELDIFTLAREAQRRRVSSWQVSTTAEIDQVRKQLLSWAKLGANCSPAQLISTIATASGLLARWLQRADAEEKLAKLELLLRYLEDFVRTHRSARLGELEALLRTLDEYNVLEVKTKGGKFGKVQLMTAHRAKGLEFDHVYVVGCTEGNWSGGRSRSDFKLPGLVATTKEDEEADDRRLFYVALTRARKELSISYPVARDDGTALLPSRFLEELPEPLLHRTPLCAQGSPVQERVARLAPVHAGKISQDELCVFVRETLSERGLAVTALNNYLACPWKYFYRNLLRVPEPQTVPLMFGNAIHRTLKAFFDAYAEKNDWSREQSLTRLERDLDRESFTDKELAQAKEEGAVALGGYYDTYHGSWQRAIKSEFPIDVTLPIVIPATWADCVSRSRQAGIQRYFDLRLTGKLDKLEFLSDSLVRVVDYKTGKPKSRNFIEGKTKEEGSGDYKRQLVFYKLLLDNRAAEDGPLRKGPSSGRWRMENGVIDFVCPGENGKYRQEVFEITKDEVRDLEMAIQKVAQEILSLDFYDRRCDDKECKYCKLRN